MIQTRSSIRLTRSLRTDHSHVPPRAKRPVEDLFSSKRIDELTSLLKESGFHVSSSSSSLAIGRLVFDETLLYIPDFSFEPQAGVSRVGVRLISDEYKHPTPKSQINSFELSFRTYIRTNQYLEGLLLFNSQTAQETACEIDRLTKSLLDFYGLILSS